jgi:signal transduction histidine kinase
LVHRPADLERIFEPYQRTHHTDGQPEAIGIGLSIARRPATIMHSDLTYRQEDHWTTFELTLAVGSRMQDG